MCRWRLQGLKVTENLPWTDAKQLQRIQLELTYMFRRQMRLSRGINLDLSWSLRSSKRSIDDRSVFCSQLIVSFKKRVIIALQKLLDTSRGLVAQKHAENGPMASGVSFSDVNWVLWSEG